MQQNIVPNNPLFDNIALLIEQAKQYVITTEGHWTLKTLRRQINSALFERLALSRDKEGVKKLATQGQIVEKPEDVIKDPYIFASAYSLYLPDKKLLQEKLAEWIAEFEA